MLVRDDSNQPEQPFGEHRNEQQHIEPFRTACSAVAKTQSVLRAFNIPEAFFYLHSLGIEVHELL